MASCRKAAQRDMRTDQEGDTYLPVGVADTSRAYPQKGQYAILWPIRYGRFFLTND